MTPGSFTSVFKNEFEMLFTLKIVGMNYLCDVMKLLCIVKMTTHRKFNFIQNVCKKSLKIVVLN